MNKINGQKAEIECFGQKYQVNLEVSTYLENPDRKAIEVLYYDDEIQMSLPFARLTVNVPEFQLEPNQCIIKDYSENEEWAWHLIRQINCFEKLFSLQLGYAIASLVQLKEGWTWE